MPREIILPQSFKERDTFSFFDDFDWYVTAHRWTTTASNSGAIAQTDAASGVIQIQPSDGTVADNDETYLLTTKELFLFANNKPLVVEARLQFTEANTDDANVAFGLANAVAANHILDDGAGPVANASMALFYKVDGGTVWRCRSQIGAAVGQTDFTPSTTSTPNGGTVSVTAGGASYQTLRIEVNPYSATYADVLFYVDATGGTSAFTLVAHHKLLYTNATEMMLWAGMKNGADTNVEALNIDYIGAAQVR